MITFQDRLDIESGTSTEYRKYATLSNVLIGIIEVLLILEEIILGTGITDVYQMIRNQFTPYRIILKIFSRTNIHAPIDLTTIGTDNLSQMRIATPNGRIHAIDMRGKCSGKTSLSTGSRTQYGNHRMFHGAKIQIFPIQTNKEIKKMGKQGKKRRISMPLCYKTSSH